MRIQYLQNEQQRRRISQIKSKKLLFPNPSINVSTIQNSQNNLNRLFRFSN